MLTLFFFAFSQFRLKMASLEPRDLQVQYSTDINRTFVCQFQIFKMKYSWLSVITDTGGRRGRKCVWEYHLAYYLSHRESEKKFSKK